MAGEWWRADDGRLDRWRSLASRRLESVRAGTRRRILHWFPHPLSLVAIGALAGVVVVFVATTFFPYHSINHDEGVYLQQASMLLEGKLQLTPPVPDAVRPWFFVQNGGRLYSKYTPISAAIFVPGVALGAPRLVLGVVAAGNVVLVGLLAREAFDWRTAVVSAGLVTTAPLFLLSSAVFLSYAPTTLLNLLFALAYLRALRRESRRYALLAGVAVGLAFFSRPFTAVLFALPFVGHAALTLLSAWLGRVQGNGDRDASRTPDAGSARDAGFVRNLGIVRDPGFVRDVTVRIGVVAVLGTAFVGVTLAYNWFLTGDPLVFPYQAFGPEDGVGFGHRELLGREVDYTPALAIDANRRVLRQLLVRWGPLGALGTGLAVLGLAATLGLPVARRLRSGASAVRTAAAARPWTSIGESRAGPSDLTCRALIGALVATVPVGNVFFWGNLNVLAALDDPTDGLIAFLGPFYHFDLLLPMAVFGAAGVVVLADRVATIAGRIERPAAKSSFLAAVLVASLAIGGASTADALEGPVDRNAGYRDDVATAYQPFESWNHRSDALVFVPTPYGDWLNHPFQVLRNDPGFDGDEVFVMDRGPAGDAESLAAFPDRRPYRFTYRGQWPPDEDGVTPVLERLSVPDGDRLRVETTVGVVANAQSATVRLVADGEAVQYGVEELGGDTETVRWTVDSGGASVVSDGLRRYSDGDSVTVDGPTTVSLLVTFTQPGGATITYRQELTVLGTDEGVRAVWPPAERVCRLTIDCGREGTYVEGGSYATGVSLSSNATAVPSDDS